MNTQNHTDKFQQNQHFETFHHRNQAHFYQIHRKYTEPIHEKLREIPIRTQKHDLVPHYQSIEVQISNR